jgi:hypothetical protein
MIAHNPLHRSGRAELPHPAPTLGNDAQAHERIRVTNASRRKPPLNDPSHAVPCQVIALAATAQDRPPQETNCSAGGTQHRTVHGHSVITEVTRKYRAQIRSLFPNGCVHASPQFFFQGPQLGLPPLAHRLSQYREVSLPGFPAAMRKTQEVERLRFAAAPVSSIVFRITAELDDPGFVGMQLKTEPRKARAQFRQKPLCFFAMLKSCHEVIGKADEDYLPARLLLPPSLDPEVEWVGRDES